eukprot:TRINITY_DN3859_c2_g1_i1.p1 TRINITY_DN3859_c2_g1~~TRINITY_DN3859_c2_g1_i1.p1  ORF type:complete len:122 (-),score=14.65 TRINITY_DN3859_c2_g1_i1:201-566(-)
MPTCCALTKKKERCKNNCVRNGNLCGVHMIQYQMNRGAFKFCPGFREKLNETIHAEKEGIKKWTKRDEQKSRKIAALKRKNDKLKKQIRQLEIRMGELGVSLSDSDGSSDSSDDDSDEPEN